MNKNFNNRVLTVSQKIYAWLLRAYPPTHREEYGPAMAQLFRDLCQDVWSESRGWGMAKLWLRVLLDLVKTSIIERLAALNKRKSMFDKMTALVQQRTIFLKVFAAVFLITVLVSVVLTYILPETYASTARIIVEPDTLVANGPRNVDPRGLDMMTGMLAEGDFRDIRSDDVLEAVVNKLNLNATWGKKYSNGETLKTVRTLDILKTRLQTAWVAGGHAHNIFSITVFSAD